MTLAELRDYRVRAMAGQPVPHEVVLALLCEVEDALDEGCCSDTSDLRPNTQCKCACESCSACEGG